MGHQQSPKKCCDDNFICIFFRVFSPDLAAVKSSDSKCLSKGVVGSAHDNHAIAEVKEPVFIADDVRR